MHIFKMSVYIMPVASETPFFPRPNTLHLVIFLPKSDLQSRSKNIKGSFLLRLLPGRDTSRFARCPDLVWMLKAQRRSASAPVQLGRHLLCSDVFRHTLTHRHRLHTPGSRRASRKLLTGVVSAGFEVFLPVCAKRLILRETSEQRP